MKDWNPQANAIFLEAADIVDTRARLQFVKQQCGTDEALRQDVDSLLSASDQALEFLEKPALTEATDAVNGAKAFDTTLQASPGMKIGRYKLLEEIGEGGFGVVYMAEQQEPVCRRVALKVIKPGMDTREVIARFEAERQALAMMDHQNIARVFDAGTTDDGRPYFVMELVNGVPVTKFCDQNKLNTQQRTEIFRTICHAVHHAHQKGVIHRDIKPSNVMITLHDGKPVPKVIDFGIVKAISRRLTDKTLFTHYGQMVGTPQYMSPEQAEMSGLDVDTRSDIYSLGVLLYELLTGTTPLQTEQFRATAYDEIVRMIRDDEPPKPSTRLSTLGARLSTICTLRNTDERHLRRLIQGDLDWITMKALDKDRSRRYESAGAFAEDIGRYLVDEPIMARPPSTVYRFQKVVRRNKVLVTTISLVLFSLVGGLLATTLAWREATEAQRLQSQQRGFAEQERDRANENAYELQRNLYASLLARAETALRGGKLSMARELIRRCPAELRQWEWQHLSRRATRTSQLALQGMELPCFTPDGQRIVAIGNRRAFDGRSVVVWDATSGKVIREVVPRNNVRFSHGALSPDGKRFATGDYDDYSLTLWDMDTGESLWQKKHVHENRIIDVVFSRDGQRVATASDDNHVKVFDAADGALIRTILAYLPRHIAFSANGEQIAYETSVKDVNTGRPFLELQDEPSRKGMAYSPSGDLLANGGLDGKIKLWDARTGALIRQLIGHASAISGLAFSPDGATLASCGVDTTVRLWDVATGQEIRILGAHQDTVFWLSFNPDGSKIASWSYKDGILVWDTVRPDVLTLRGHDTPIRCPPVYTPDGRHLAAAAVGGVIKVWDVASGKVIRTLHGDETGIISLAIHPSGQWFVTGSLEGKVQLRDFNTGKLIQSYDGHEGRVLHVAFKPSGDLLVTVGGSQIRTWDVVSGEKKLGLEKVSGQVMACSPDGKWIAAMKRDSTGRYLMLWNIRNGNVERKFPNQSSATALAFSTALPGDGTFSRPQLACGTDGTIELWNPETGQHIRTLRGQSASWIISLVFSADGKRLWSASLDGSITVWNSQTGDELLSFHGHSATFWITLSPDETTVASASLDKTIKLWETVPPSTEGGTDRRVVELARRIVEDRFRKLTFADQVSDSLRSDTSLDPTVRAVAVELADARGNNAFTLNREGLDIAGTPDRKLQEYQLALRKAEVACRIVPESSNCRTTLGMAQYRLGQFEDALASLKRADQNFVPARTTANEHSLGEPNHRRNIAFIAMSLYRLGRIEEARQEFRKLRGLMQDQWAHHAELDELLHEAQQLID